MSTNALPGTLQNHRTNSIIDPLSVDDFIPSGTPQIQARLSARVWAVGKYVALGGAVGFVAGAMAGTLFGRFTGSSEKTSSSSDTGQVPLNGAILGGLVGIGIGTCYSLFRDHYFHFRLRTDLIGKEGDGVRKVALEKANFIFKAYANKNFGNSEGLCDEHFDFNLFIYPVQGGDGKIYEHSSIYRYLTVNYPAAVKAYEKRRGEFPNDPTVLPPHSSPAGGKEVTVQNLTLQPKTMKEVSEKMAAFFKNLKKWELQIQAGIDEAHNNDNFSVSLTPKTTISEEKIRAVDEKTLAEKVCSKKSLSLDEIFIIKQLFDYYLVEIKERDFRIYKAISSALITQREEKILSEARFFEETQELMKWYTSSKDLYK